MVRAQALGYLEEDELGDALLLGLETLIDGRYFISRASTARMRGAMSLANSIDAVGVDAGLTIRQREVLARVVEGARYKEIADALHISPATVETHCRRIRERLGVETRAQLIRHVLSQGLYVNPYNTVRQPMAG